MPGLSVLLLTESRDLRPRDTYRWWHAERRLPAGAAWAALGTSRRRLDEAEAEVGAGGCFTTAGSPQQVACFGRREIRAYFFIINLQSILKWRRHSAGRTPGGTPPPQGWVPGPQ